MSEIGSSFGRGCWGWVARKTPSPRFRPVDWDRPFFFAET